MQTQTNDPYRTDAGEVKKYTWADDCDEIEDAEEEEKREQEEAEESDEIEDEEEHRKERHQENQSMLIEKSTEGIRQEKEAVNDELLNGKSKNGNATIEYQIGKNESAATETNMRDKIHGTEQPGARGTEELEMNTVTKGMDMDMENNEHNENSNTAGPTSKIQKERTNPRKRILTCAMPTEQSSQ